MNYDRLNKTLEIFSDSLWDQTGSSTLKLIRKPGQLKKDSNWDFFVGLMLDLAQTLREAANSTATMQFTR